MNILNYLYNQNHDLDQQEDSLAVTVGSRDPKPLPGELVRDAIYIIKDALDGQSNLENDSLILH